MRRWQAVLVAAALLLGGLWLDLPQRGLAWATGHRSPHVPARVLDCADPAGCSSGPLRVMTLNVMCSRCVKPGYPPWEERAPALAALVREESPDLLALQELDRAAALHSLGLDDSYEVVAPTFLGWTNGDAAVLVKRSRAQVRDGGQVWLGPRPGVPMSHAWAPLSFPRYANVVGVRLRDPAFELALVSAHLDNNRGNQAPAADLLGARVLDPLAARMPVIFAGDLNTRRSDDRFDAIVGTRLRSAADLAALSHASQVDVADRDLPGSGYGTAARRPDHVLIGGARAVVSRYAVRFPQVDGKPASDHAAVIVDLSLVAPRP